MSERRQHLAWLVLLAGFLLCISLIVLIPVSINAVVQGARRSLNVSVQANQGTVGVRQNGGEPAALFAGSEPIELVPGGSVLTNATDTALLLSYTPDDEQLIVRIQIYGNTNFQMEEASTPRFQSSSSTRRLRLVLDVGRMHMTVPQFDGKPVQIEVTTPQGSITVNEPGQYSVLSSNLETQIAVLQGQAEVVGNGDVLVLLTDQRAIIPTGGELQGPVDTERNLLVNGDFSQQVDGWVPLASKL
jgi:ferric-dicitrate binding protein FerR (iron transport regulator)